MADDNRQLQSYPDLMTVDELACFLDVGLNSAYRLVRSGRIGSIRIGSLYRIPKRALADWINREYNDCTGRASTGSDKQEG